MLKNIMPIFSNLVHDSPRTLMIMTHDRNMAANVDLISPIAPGDSK
jgi:ABC-type lipoprotein export system ATPase subunit